MSIQIREVTSNEMDKNIKTVKKMTSGMGFDENMEKVNWAAVRRVSNFGYRFMPKDKGVKFKKVLFGNIKCEMAIPLKQNSDNIILYIHGGGFVSGSAQSSRGYCSMLANYSGCRVIAVNYALAPEHPYPDGVNNCFDVYRVILNNYHCKIALIGESAGANLCLVTAHKAIKAGISAPSCVIVHSPIVDFSGSLDRTQHVNDFTVKDGFLKPLNNIYTQNTELTNFEVSPIYAEMTGFPPLSISCDYNETLFADAMALYEKAVVSNVPAYLVQMKGAFHAFATIGTGAPETMQLLKENVQFIVDNFNATLPIFR